MKAKQNIKGKKISFFLPLLPVHVPDVITVQYIL